MKDYRKTLENLDWEIDEAIKKISELGDKAAVVRLEMNAIYILISSKVKDVEQALPMLLAIAHQELITTSWENCVAILKARRGDLW